MKKIIRTGLLVGLFSIVIYFIFISISISLSKDNQGDNFIESYIYWFLLIGLLYFIWQWKKNSRFSLYLSFVSFIVSSIIVILGFKFVGEFFMRLSFICLLIGYLQSFRENKKIIESN